MSRTARRLLWLRCVLRRHPLTGKRVRHLRWQLDAGHSRPIWRLRGRSDLNGTWSGWEWPG